MIFTLLICVEFECSVMYKLLNLNVTLLNLNVRMLNSIRKRYILVTSGVSKKTLTKIQDYSRHFSQEQKSMGVAQLFFFNGLRFHELTTSLNAIE